MSTDKCKYSLIDRTAKIIIANKIIQHWPWLYKKSGYILSCCNLDSFAQINLENCKGFTNPHNESLFEEIVLCQ